MTKSVTSQPSSAALQNIMPFNRINNAQLQAWSDFGEGMMQFSASRMQQNVEAQKAVLTCRTPQEFKQIQTEYYKKAMTDYQTQIQRAMDVMAGAVGQKLGDRLTSTKRGYDDVPL